MKQKIRYILFVGVPFLVCGGFWFVAGAMHGQGSSELTNWEFRDTFNFLAGGLPAALIGWFIEYLTRKKQV
jgi:hypothetical protein